MYLTLSFFDLEPYEAHYQVFLNETMEPWEFTMESFTDFLVWPLSKGHFPTVGGRRGAPLGENTTGEVDATKWCFDFSFV